MYAFPSQSVYCCCILICKNSISMVSTSGSTSQTYTSQFISTFVRWVGRWSIRCDCTARLFQSEKKSVIRCEKTVRKNHVYKMKCWCWSWSFCMDQLSRNSWIFFLDSISPQPVLWMIFKIIIFFSWQYTNLNRSRIAPPWNHQIQTVQAEILINLRFIVMSHVFVVFNIYKETKTERRV